MDTSEIVNVSIGLSATPASQANFTVPMLLVDHADVPVDKDFRIVTRSSYATDLTASTDALSWATSLWGQNYNPSQAYIGRWYSAATASYCYFPNATTVAATYAALTSTGQFKLLEGGAGGVDFNPDFSGDSTMGDVCASIQATFTGIYASYTCALDAYDRIVITSDNTGDSADTVTVESPAAGTDLTGALYFGTEVSEGGHDIEALGTAMNRILAIDNTPFVMCQRGGSIAQKLAFSTAVNALDKILLLNDADSNSKDSGDATDVCYQIEALGHNKTYICYSEHTTHNPDAAFCGEIMPRTEATTNFALTPLTGVSESGLHGDGTTVIPLTATERSALDAKGCDYLVNPAGSVHAVNGLAAGGHEMRVTIGRMFLAAKITEDIYGYLVANDVVTYSDADLQAIKGLMQYWLDEMGDRKLLDLTTLVWNMPSAADFTAAVKATHTMTLSDVFSVDVQSAVNDITITSSFTV